ncbi:MAG: hypothetical protein KAH86_03745 [Methanosarcinales archaeon]|nr:hypothetical protein [Methanosarcinales archaeon]
MTTYKWEWISLTKWKIYFPYKLILLIFIAILVILSLSLVAANQLYGKSNTNSLSASLIIEALRGTSMIISDILMSFMLIIPILLMVYIIVAKKEKLWHIPALGWVILFLGSLVKGYYTIKFFDPGLEVPLVVPIAAFLGATSYITVSTLENKEKELPESEWINIRCAYGRRLFMAPYIAIIALFTISATMPDNNQAQWPMVFFAYFVGLYTKAIEGTLEEIGMKFLTERQKIERHTRVLRYSEIVTKLDVSTSVAYNLKTQKIIKICDLIAMREENIEQIAKKAEMDESYLRGLIEKAKNIPEQESEDA